MAKAKKSKTKAEVEEKVEVEMATDQGGSEDIVKEQQAKEAARENKSNPNLHWYVLNTRTGYENAVAEAIKQRVEATGLIDLVKEVLVPVQKKIVIKKGKQTIKEEKFYPGYVLVKMVLNDESFSVITSTEGVRGFVKTDKYPRPLAEKEVDAIMKFMEVDQPAYQASFSVGEAVKIVDGPFADFIGTVSEIDETKGRVKVMISFLGREAPVDLEFSQVSKL